MRAVLIKDEAGDASSLYISDAPTPAPRADEVLVKVCTHRNARELDLIPAQIKMFGLNRLDIMQRDGHYPPPPGASSILGVEFAGHVDAIGADVTQWKVGDEVLGLTGGVVPLTLLLAFI